MFQNLLVPLDGSPYFLKAVEYAAHWAKPHGAKLTALAPIHLEEGSVVPPHLSEQVHRSIEEFKLLMTQQHISKEYYQIKEVTGDPFHKIIREAVFHDALVVGQKCHFPPQIRPDDSLERLLFRSSRPILFTPLEFRPIRTIVLGIDGTAPSSRLIYLFTKLNPFPQAKVILVQTQWEREKYQLQEFFQRVEGLFQAAKIEVQSVTVDQLFKSALLEVAQKFQADLISFGILEEVHADKVHFDQSIVKSIMENSRLPVFTLR